MSKPLLSLWIGAGDPPRRGVPPPAEGAAPPRAAPPTRPAAALPRPASWPVPTPTAPPSPLGAPSGWPPAAPCAPPPVCGVSPRRRRRLLRPEPCSPCCQAPPPPSSQTAHRRCRRLSEHESCRLAACQRRSHRRPPARLPPRQHARRGATGPAPDRGARARARLPSPPRSPWAPDSPALTAAMLTPTGPRPIPPEHSWGAFPPPPAGRPLPFPTLAPSNGAVAPNPAAAGTGGPGPGAKPLRAVSSPPPGAAPPPPGPLLCRAHRLLSHCATHPPPPCALQPKRTLRGRGQGRGGRGPPHARQPTPPLASRSATRAAKRCRRRACAMQSIMGGAESLRRFAGVASGMLRA